jgi:hypothetical protein
MDNQELIELNLEVSASDATGEEIDRLTRQLLTELKQTSVESAELVKGGSAPLGTKSIDPITAGAIAIAVLPPMLTKIIETLQSWLMRDTNRKIKFKGKVAGQVIEFEGSAEDLQKLIETLSGKKMGK